MSAVAAVLAEESQRRAQRLTRALLWGLLAAGVLWFTARQIGLNPVALARGAPFMADFFSRMFPPDLGHLALLRDATIETVQIAVWGTLIAIGLSIPLAKARMADVPANRFGTAEEFGRACAFLCSAHAGFIVGQNLLIDGGAVNLT